MEENRSTASRSSDKTEELELDSSHTQKATIQYHIPCLTLETTVEEEVGMSKELLEAQHRRRIKDKLHGMMQTEQPRTE